MCVCYGMHMRVLLHAHARVCLRYIIMCRRAPVSMCVCVGGGGGRGACLRTCVLVCVCLCGGGGGGVVRVYVRAYLRVRARSA